MRNNFLLSFLIVLLSFGCSKDNLIVEDAKSSPNIPAQTIKVNTGNKATTDIGNVEHKILQQNKTAPQITNSFGLDEGQNDFGDPVDGFGDPVNDFPTDDPDTDNDGGAPPSSNFGCPGWVAPVASRDTQEVTIDIYYNRLIVAQDEINCIRKEFFEKYCYIRMSRFQDSLDPFHDIWTYEYTPECSPGTPPSAGVTTNNATQEAEDDDRTCVRNRCR